MEGIKIESLIGLHKLSGAENIFIDGQYGGTDINGFMFTLDGITYIAQEDPQDGYRSCLKNLKITNKKQTVTFTPFDVFCKMGEGDYEMVLKMYSVKSAKLVLEVGTKYYNDYYPVYIARFISRNA